MIVHFYLPTLNFTTINILVMETNVTKFIITVLDPGSLKGFYHCDIVFFVSSMENDTIFMFKCIKKKFTVIDTLF